MSEVLVEVVLVVVEVVGMVDVVEEGSFHSLTKPKSAHKKGLGHALVLISSTVSTRETGISRDRLSALVWWDRWYSMMW